MGATVTVGKRALALRGDNGAISYALLENLYEKNVYPHTPRWSAVAFGRIEEVMDTIFLYASGTADGLLQGRNGWIEPQAYVTGWLRALANPQPFRQGPTKDIRSELTAGKVEAVRKAGYPDLADRLQADLEGGGGIVLDFQKSPDAIAALVKQGGLPAWTLIDSRAAYREEDPSYPGLGYRPMKAKGSPFSGAAPVEALPAGFLVNLAGDGASKNVVIRKPDGSLTLGGPLWREKERFIQGYARYELAYPGRFAESWARFGDHLAGLPDLPEDTIVRVDPSHADQWVREEAQELARRMGPDGARLADLSEKDRWGIARCSGAVVLAPGPQMQSLLGGDVSAEPGTPEDEEEPAGPVMG
jgi:hypothetical protein